MNDRDRCTPEEQALARQQMNYWRRNRTADNLFASELAFSLIYDNIDPARLSDALATMGLARLPERMILLQVDDYRGKYGGLAVTNEFSVKAVTRKYLQERLESLGHTGFAANLVGLDTLVCFVSDLEGDAAAADLARDLCQHVWQETAVSLTACVSPPCKTQGDYPLAYAKLREQLYNSYYLGRDADILTAGAQPPLEEAALLGDYYGATFAISSGDRVRFQQITAQLCRDLKTHGVEPRRARLSMVTLVQHMGAYATLCGVDQDREFALTARYADMIFSSSYIKDGADRLLDYYDAVTALVSGLQNRSRADAFREPIREYVHHHYGEALSLEQMAALSGYSRCYFTRLFRQYFGCTWTEFLTRFRLERSKELLARENVAVGEIAARCGFESANYFSICFRRQEGISPSAWRAAHTEQQ